jgi:hypothetical protein
LYRQKRRALERSVLETAQALSRAVDQELANMQASTTALATSSSLTAGDLAAFHHQTQLVLRDYPGSDIILTDATGQQLVNSLVPFGKPLPKRSVPIAAPSVYATGRPAISNLFKEVATGRPLISIDVPVFRSDRVVYDLALTVPAERLVAVFSQQRISPEWAASILDSNHVLVARNGSWERYVTRRANPALVSRLAEAAEGSVEIVNRQRVDIFAIFSRSTTTGYTAVIRIPEAIFVADIWHSLQWTVSGIVLLFLAGIGLAILFGKAHCRINSGLGNCSSIRVATESRPSPQRKR